MIRIGNSRRKTKIFFSPKNKMYGAMIQIPEKIGKFGEWKGVGFFKSKAEARKKLEQLM